MELWDHVSDKIGLTSVEERQCVKNILMNAILLNDSRGSDLSEKAIDALVKVTDAFVREVLKVINDPVAYEAKLKEFRQRLIDNNITEGNV